MDITPTCISGAWEIRAPVHRDPRGSFAKSFHAEAFSAHGLNTVWRELFTSTSARGVLRGLHFQIPPADQAKLVSCVAGRVWDVAVDLRRSSPTFGQHVARELSAANGLHLYLARGLAHGFLALDEGSVVSYAVETAHDPTCDRGVRWDSCGIPWPLNGLPTISARDAALPALASFESPF